MIIKRDQAFRVVCNIRTPKEGGETVGTAMFVSNEKNEAWIITASHVAIETTLNTNIALGDENNNCSVIPINVFNPKLNWKHHPVADLAVLEIVINQRNINLLSNRCFPYDHLNLSKDSVSRDFELTAIGFPNGLGIQGKFSPLTFRSYASSSFLTLHRADTHTPSEFFCLENPSIGGYSGGPVFDLGYMVVGAMTTTKEKTVCHGFMHGTMSDNTGGKIALVTPAYYLADIL